jgi:hypothetical protein
LEEDPLGEVIYEFGGIEDLLDLVEIFEELFNIEIPEIDVPIINEIVIPEPIIPIVNEIVIPEPEIPIVHEVEIPEPEIPVVDENMADPPLPPPHPTQGGQSTARI